MSLKSHERNGERVHGDSLDSLSAISAEGVDVNLQGSVELSEQHKTVPTQTEQI